MQMTLLLLIIACVVFIGCNNGSPTVQPRLPPQLNADGVAWDATAETVTVYPSDVRGPITDDFLLKLADIPQLRGLLVDSLHPDDNSITDSGLAVLSELPRLERLRLRHAHITNNGVEQIVQLEHLSMLDLSGTMVDDEGIKLIAHGLPRLTELSLSGTAVTDSCVPALALCKDLATLDLIDSQVSQTGLGEIREALPGCHIVHSQSLGATSSQ